MRNGDLRRAAEVADFEAILTTDQNLRYPQNLEGRQLAILVLLTSDWRLIRQHTEYVATAVAGLLPGAYIELPFPPSPAARDLKKFAD